MKNLILLFICVIAIGCESPKISPPKFSRGDLVKIKVSAADVYGTKPSIYSGEYGYVYSVYRTSDSFNKAIWRYEIIFESRNIFYNEIDILLVKRAVWHEPIQAETTNMQDFNSIQGQK